MGWLATTPARLASLVLVACGFWLVYWRRRLAPARVLMVLTVCVTLFFMVLPMALMPWNSTFALQAASGPAPAADTARITLRNPRVCFPAARRAELATDAAFVAARQEAASRCGMTRSCRAMSDRTPSPSSPASKPRGLPLDWRVKLNYVQADYSAGGAPLYSLRPARYITDEPAVDRWRMPGCCRKARCKSCEARSPSSNSRIR